MGELLSASLPQFPHRPHRRGGRGQLQGWFKRGVEEWGWTPGPLQRGAGGAQSHSMKDKVTKAWKRREELGHGGRPFSPLTVGLFLFSDGSGDGERYPQERGEG